MIEPQVIVYLERRKTRQMVGRLTRKKDSGKFNFKYERSYLTTPSAIPVGEELLLGRQTYESDTLFPTFTDRIPSRENPAYAEYCLATGVDVDEQDPLVLLGSIGRRGPSSFIYETVYETPFTSQGLKNFRHDLGLTTREFATCFDLTQSTLIKLENGHQSGTELLKRLRIYACFPIVAIDQLSRSGGILTDPKRRTCQRVLKKRTEGSLLNSSFSK